MNYPTVKEWIKALESGKYTKGRGQLRSPHNEFCCLGVLADLIDPEGWKARSRTDNRPFFTHKTSKSSAGYLSEETLAVYGVTPENQAVITERNDTSSSFAPVRALLENLVRSGDLHDPIPPGKEAT